MQLFHSSVAEIGGPEPPELRAPYRMLTVDASPSLGFHSLRTLEIGQCRFVAIIETSEQVWICGKIDVRIPIGSSVPPSIELRASF
jgi:hypothetical protein